MTILPTLTLLALALVVASAVPFLPTGEIVAGGLAWHGASPWIAVAVFVVSWAASAAGDTLLFVESRYVARRVRGRMSGRSRARTSGPRGRRVGAVAARIERGPVTGMAVARLVPGARAPMIIALAATGVPGRRFLLGDVIGCGLWSLLYTLIGTVGANLTDDPFLGVGVAVLLAAVVGVVGSRARAGSPELQRLTDPDDVLADDSAA